MQRIDSKMKRRKFICIVLLIAIVSFAYYAYTFNLPKWFPFNEENALSEWQEKIFKDRVLYVVESEKKEGYLSAQSQEACSGLVHRIKFDPRKFPIVSWQWKVTQFPKRTNNVEQKEGWLEQDDYAARFYIIFANWNFLNIKSLEYIWDESLPEGTIKSSPYSDNIKLIVAESGKDNINRWVLEKRNIPEDYKKAFGCKCPARVGAIALMTDSDNTISTAEAFYKDIKVGCKDE